MTLRHEGPGSRFVLDSFDAAQARIEANERVLEQRWRGLEFRLSQIDAALERLERRLWLGVCAAAGFLLTEAAQAVIRAAMR